MSSDEGTELDLISEGSSLVGKDLFATQHDPRAACCVFMGGMVVPAALVVLAWMHEPLAIELGGLCDGRGADSTDADISEVDRFYQATFSPMPFYLQFTGTLTSTLTTLFVFGPPKVVAKKVVTDLTARMKQLASWGGQVCFICLAYYCLVIDVQRYRRLLKADCLDIWEKIVAVGIVLANSGNLSSSIKVAGINSIFQARAQWLVGHWAEANGEYINPIDLQQETQGTLFNIYMWVFIFGYMIIGFLWILLLLLPVCIAYIPFFGLLFFGLYTVIDRFLLPVFLSAFFKNKLHPGDYQIEAGSTPPPWDLPKHEEVSLMKRDLVTMNVLKNVEEVTDESVQEKYEAEADVFDRSGTPRNGWLQFFLIAIIAPCAAQMVGTMAWRLYTGHGYVASFVDTLSERRAATYFGLLTTQLTTKIDFLNTFLA